MMKGYFRNRTVIQLACLVICAGTLLGNQPAAQGASPLSLPPGFLDERVVSGLITPRAFVFAPDGRIFIAERGKEGSQDQNFASIRVFKGGSLLPQRAVSFDVCGDGERGFLGLALDPNFSANGYVYVYYTSQRSISPVCNYGIGTDVPKNRVSRMTMVGDTIDPNSELVLVDNIYSNAGIHNAGDIQFGGDGYLYISTGDAANGSNAKNLSNLNGKILRIQPTSNRYTIPSGNPYANASNGRLCGTDPTGDGPCKEIFAYGLRNPFRITIDPVSGDSFAFDVGGGSWEEINRVISGGYYGQPEREGPCQSPSCSAPGSIDPVYAYQHNDPNSDNDAAIIGGAFYTGTSYPDSYRNNLFFADFVRGWIKRLVYDQQNGRWNAQSFATGGDAIIGVRTGPDTNLYYLEIGEDFDSSIRRIRYSAGANQPPIAKISANPLNSPVVETMFTFSASGSSDPESGTLRYNWDLGDGTTTTTNEPTISYQYGAPGKKTVTLTVTDNGAPPQTSEPARIDVFPGNTLPTVNLQLMNDTTPDRQRYHAGDIWRFAATDITDDQPLPGTPITWTVDLYHRDHHHPFLSGVGAEGTFTIPTIGETDHVVWYRVTLRITDAQGQTATVFRDVFPITNTLTLATNPPGGTVLLEDHPHSTPLTLPRVAGMELKIAAPSPQQIGAAPHVFSSWSNGAAQEQIITMPAATAAYTATFVTQGKQTLWIPLAIR
jgi:glucose/arabinose dehydrogenase